MVPEYKGSLSSSSFYRVHRVFHIEEIEDVYRRYEGPDTYFEVQVWDAGVLTECALARHVGPGTSTRQMIISPHDTT